MDLMVACHFLPSLSLSTDGVTTVLPMLSSIPPVPLLKRVPPLLLLLLLLLPTVIIWHLNALIVLSIAFNSTTYQPSHC